MLKRPEREADHSPLPVRRLRIDRGLHRDGLYFVMENVKDLAECSNL